MFSTQGVADSVTTEDDDAMLKCLIDLAENTPKFLRGNVDNILNLCIKVCFVIISTAWFLVFGLAYKNWGVFFICFLNRIRIFFNDMWISVILID